jgi:hypothetical protein
LYVAGALLACVYVLVYNNNQLIRNAPTGRALVAVAVILLKVQWAGFAVPFTAVIAWCWVKKDSPWRELAPDLLAIFSVGWILLSVLIWEIHQPPVVAYPGFR